MCKNKAPLDDFIMEIVRSPDPEPFLFIKGQTARVYKFVIKDGQTPEYWGGAKVKILNKFRTLLWKTHICKVDHLENGRICEFSEDELDKRYIKKSKISK